MATKRLASGDNARSWTRWLAPQSATILPRVFHCVMPSPLSRWPVTNVCPFGAHTQLLTGSENAVKTCWSSPVYALLVNTKKASVWYLRSRPITEHVYLESMWQSLSRPGSTQEHIFRSRVLLKYEELQKSQLRKWLQLHLPHHLPNVYRRLRKQPAIPRQYVYWAPRDCSLGSHSDRKHGLDIETAKQLYYGVNNCWFDSVSLVLAIWLNDAREASLMERYILASVSNAITTSTLAILTWKFRKKMMPRLAIRTVPFSSSHKIVVIITH